LTAIGQSLRDARTARNLSLEQAAQDTRISIRFLEALEEEDFTALPAPVYVRGFLRSYANYLGIDPQPLVEGLRANEENGAAHRRSADPFQPSVSVAHPVPLSVLADEVGEEGAAYEGEDEEDWDQAGAAVWDGDDSAYAEPGRSRSRVVGVLNEREGDGGGATRIAMIVAGVAVLIVVFLGVMLVLGGGDDGNNVLAPVAEPTATATLATGTVIEVGSPTVEGTAPAAGATGTAEAAATAAAGAETSTPGSAEATATATPSGSNPTATPIQPTATSTPPPTATATATPTPPLPTPTPIPTPTVMPHPYAFNECPDNTCGNPVLVVCAPDGWFVDVPPYGNWPPEWPRVEVLTSGQAINACQ
jgi:cytoskeleton protein RodZ